jgi:CBS-domain-containing membrane protein
MRRFYFRHMQASSLTTALVAGLGAALMIAAIFYLGDLIKSPMIVASFGATAVLLFATPASPVSQPINVIGGHMVSACIGLALAGIMIDNHWLAGLSVGLSVSAMMLLRIVNPPAGATGLVAYLTHPGWMFLFFPVLIGSIALIVIASVFHHARGVEYPIMPK